MQKTIENTWNEYARYFGPLVSELDDQTGLEWDVCHTGGGCFCVEAADDMGCLWRLTDGEAQLPQEMKGPWGLYYYNTDGDEEECFSGVVVRSPNELARKVDWCVRQGWTEGESRQAVLSCPECARSFGPHYTGPCEH